MTNFYREYMASQANYSLGLLLLRLAIGNSEHIKYIRSTQDCIIEVR